MKRPAKKHTYDDTLLVTVLILVLVGLILLTSTSAYNGRVKFHDSYYYLKKQGLATVLGMAGMLWIARIDYHRWFHLLCQDIWLQSVYPLLSWHSEKNITDPKDGCLWVRFLFSLQNLLK